MNDTIRRKLANRIARGYWVTSQHVYDLLEFGDDDEAAVRNFLDIMSPLGFVPTVYGLKKMRSELRQDYVPRETSENIKENA